MASIFNYITEPLQMKKLTIAGITGAVLGFTYWYYVGCMSGSCPITSSPIVSTIYGAILGIGVVNLSSKR